MSVKKRGVIPLSSINAISVSAADNAFSRLASSNNGAVIPRISRQLSGDSLKSVFKSPHDCNSFSATWRAHAFHLRKCNRIAKGFGRYQNRNRLDQVILEIFSQLISPGCPPVDSGDALYFSPGTQFIVAFPVNVLVEYIFRAFPS